MKQVTLSMIVPIYGVEPYIDRFLDSLTKNLHDEMEVILVDDGTKDRSGEIIDQYQVRYPNHVQVIHKENGGVSSARNVGLARARGEYVLFVDPDDRLADDYTETVLRAIDTYRQADVILFDHYEERNGKVKYRNAAPFTVGEVDKREFLTAFVKDNKIRSYLWNKIIKRSLCDITPFDESLHFCEDACFLTDVMLHAECIAYAKKAIYYYVRRDDSLTAEVQTKPERIVSAIQIYSDRYYKYRDAIGKVSCFAPMKFMMTYCRVVYSGGIAGDTSSYEKYIRKNLFSVLCDRDVPIQ